MLVQVSCTFSVILVKHQGVEYGWKALHPTSAQQKQPKFDK
jgi:hypothetical protein